MDGLHGVRPGVWGIFYGWDFRECDLGGFRRRDMRSERPRRLASSISQVLEAFGRSLRF